MHWSHALMMAELLMKAADQIDTIRPTATTKEDATMGDQAPTDTPVTPPVMIDNDPTTTPPDSPPVTPPLTPPVVPTDVATDINAAPTQAPAPETDATTPSATAQAPTEDKPDVLHQSLSDLLRLVEILNETPELLDILKRMLPSAPSSTS